MGGYLSSGQAASESDLNETPQSPGRVLTSDPRSPTQDIQRTPIQINSETSADENTSPSGTSGSDKEKVRRRTLRQKLFDKKHREEKRAERDAMRNSSNNHGSN